MTNKLWKDETREIEKRRREREYTEEARGDIHRWSKKEKKRERERERASEKSKRKIDDSQR